MKWKCWFRHDYTGWIPGRLTVFWTLADRFRLCKRCGKKQKHTLAVEIS